MPLEQLPGAAQFDEIRYEASAGVATITLNRPQVLNVISARAGGTRDQLLAAVALAEADERVGCILLQGEGSSFCGGGDLTGNAKRERALEDLRFVESAAEFHRAIASSLLPTVAAVHGHCLGAGVLLAASCDIVVAAQSTRIGFPEGRLGMAGASALVPVIGRQWANFLMLTGEMLTAQQAKDIGLVLTVEPDSEVHARSLDLAGRISRMPREGVQLNRQAIDAVAEAAGGAAARVAAIAHDTITLAMGAHATAPDGRTFRSIIESEGMQGMKAARAAQFSDPWLR